MYQFEKLLANNTSLDAKVLFYPSCGCENIRPELFDLDYDVFILSDYGSTCGDYNFANLIKKQAIAMDDYKVMLRDYRAATITDRQRFVKSFTATLHNGRDSKKDDNNLVILDFDDNWIHWTYKNKHIALFMWDNNITLALLNNMGVKISCFVGVNDGCQEGGNYECVNNTNWLARVYNLITNSGLIYITDHFDGYDNYTLDLPLNIFPDGYQVTLLDQQAWMISNKLNKSPFRPLFTQNGELFIYQINR